MTAMGAYVGNSPDKIPGLEAFLGHSVDFVRAHTGRADWADWDGSIGWESGLWAGTGRSIAWSIPLFANQGDLASAAAGAYKSHYVQAAKTILAGQPNDSVIYIRMGEEFNGDWMPWAAQGKEQSFIAAYRNFVDAFRSVSPKFKFEWNVNLGGSMDPAAAYPGDAYVDVIGMDFYYNTQWDPADPATAWASKVSQPYGLQWHQDFAAAHGKPTAYSEWGMNSDAAAYISKAAQWFADHNVLYQSYWDVNDYGYNSEIGQYAGASGAFQRAFGSSVAASQASVQEGGAASYLISLPGPAATDQIINYKVDGGAVQTAVVKAGQSSVRVNVQTVNDGVAGTIEGKTADAHVLALSNGASATVTITDAQSGAAGGLAITSAGAVTNARSQTISGTADPSKAGAVVHILDAGPSGTIEIGTATVQANGAWSATAQLSAVEGNHLVSATLDGGSSPAVAYTLDWTPAVVTGTQSVSGLSNKTVETLTIKATDSPAGVKSVEVFDNGVDIGAATLTSAGWSFTTGKLADGAHAFTAAATDKAGNVSAAVSTGAVLTVDTVAPSVILTDATRATAGAKTATTVFGHAEAGATVTLSANGSVVASGIAADAKGDWSFTSSSIQANRLTTLTAVATDVAGNKGAVSNELVLGTASTDKITDASPGVVFVAGSGADTITSGGGADRFVFHVGFGKDVITNFQPGASATAVHDVIVLDRVIAGLAGISSDSALAAYVLGRTTDTASGALLQLTATDSILLQHVTKSQILPSDFHLI